MRFFSLLFWIVVMGILTSGKNSLAQQTRTIFTTGFGDAVAKSASSSKSTRKESPGAFGVSIDFPLSGPYFIFAEHFRSLGSSGSSVGFTGAGLKFYPWLSPKMTKNISGKDSSQISMQGYLTYFGLGLGFAQASIVSNSTQDDVLAAGGYISLKSGVEYPMSDSWGFVGEWNYGTAVMGSGAIEVINLLFGGYLTF